MPSPFYPLLCNLADNAWERDVCFKHHALIINSKPAAIKNKDDFKLKHNDDPINYKRTSLLRHDNDSRSITSYE